MRAFILKILYINAVCGVGSTGRIVTDLMKEAKQQGHTVKVACSTVEPIRNADPEDVIIVGSKIDYYVHNALSRLTDHEGLYSKAATKKLIRQIREYDPDLIHLHNLHGHWINYELLFKYLAAEDKKVIWTLHDCWAFTGHCSHFSTWGCEQWKERCTDCPGLRSYPICYSKGDVKRNYSKKKNHFAALNKMTIVTPSDWLAQVVRSSFLGKFSVIPIPNGVDLNIFKKKDSNFRHKQGLDTKIILLGVANVWSERKGFNDIIKLRQLLSDDYSIILVGLTREQIEKLPEGIIGILRTSSTTELAELYSSADIFVNPSYQETMGLVTVEAVACGTPAIVYDQTAVPEVIDHNCGVVVRAGDVEGLYSAVISMSKHLEHYKDVAKSAIKYEKAKQYRKYLDLYENV